MKRKGFSLVEVVVVIAIIGIMASFAVAGYGRLLQRYRVERQLQEMYSDMSRTRYMAMHRNRVHFFVLGGSQYNAYDDTTDGSAPVYNGDGILQQSSDTAVLDGGQPKSLYFPIQWNGSSTIAFDTKGIARNPGTICIPNDVKPMHDCIIVSQARIAKGCLSNGTGECNASNCIAE